MEACNRNGLRNLGSSCYLNALVQALARVACVASFFYASPRRDSCRLGVLSCVDCQVGKVVRGNRLRGVADVGEMLDLLREGEWEVFRRGEQSDYSEAFRELVTHHAATTMASFFNGKVCRSAKCAGCRSDAVAKVEAMNSVDVAIGPDETCVAQAVEAFFPGQG